MIVHVEKYNMLCWQSSHNSGDGFHNRISITVDPQNGKKGARESLKMNKVGSLLSSSRHPARPCSIINFDMALQVTGSCNCTFL